MMLNLPMLSDPVIPLSLPRIILIPNQNFLPIKDHLHLPRIGLWVQTSTYTRHPNKKVVNTFICESSNYREGLSSHLGFRI
jgi:hypothetical protein